MNTGYNKGHRVLGLAVAFASIAYAAGVSHAQQRWDASNLGQACGSQETADMIAEAYVLSMPLLPPEQLQSHIMQNRDHFLLVIEDGRVQYIGKAAFCMLWLPERIRAVAAAHMRESIESHNDRLETARTNSTIDQMFGGSGASGSVPEPLHVQLEGIARHMQNLSVAFMTVAANGDTSMVQQVWDAEVKLQLQRSGMGDIVGALYGDNLFGFMRNLLRSDPATAAAVNESLRQEKAYISVIVQVACQQRYGPVLLHVTPEELINQSIAQ
ncbi:hypothetical protein [Haliangium sp.]|uniref:hypothetical protein n=1 Tax=Haliangium sp. TaxID=2663208 RepID=UPI003D132222